MSELAISAKNLTKIYRLYSNPHYRFLDIFGLLRKKEGAYTEHAALDGVDLDVHCGEKVALIGRNGAGKSTLLKLITRVIEPTTGSLDVKAGVRALLQLGTGFHPEFTGRQNVLSYLAHLGASRTEATTKLAEIIEFSELEEYIDQPIKTYSTGMVARLMFSTSTALKPDILVLDEVLGVGDAYFAQKSYERIRELCSGSGTTVMLVSHDVYSAAQLCERMIWIDHGRIIIDGESPLVIKAYEDSIRQQEERRLRIKKQNRLKELRQQASDVEHLIVEVCSRNNLPMPCPIYFSGISLQASDSRERPASLTGGGLPSEDFSQIDPETECWGEPEEISGRVARPFRDHGSPHRKVSLVFMLTGQMKSNLAELCLCFDYLSRRPCDVFIRAYRGDRELDLGTLPASHDEWLRHCVAVESGSAHHRPASEINTRGVQGSGLITISDVRCVDHQKKPSFHFLHGKPMTLEIDYLIRKRGFREKAQCLVAFQRDGVHDVCRIITRDLCFDEHAQASGTISMHLPKLILANGHYTISVLIGREGYYDSDQTVFYSVNPAVYSALNRVLEIVICGGGMLATGTGVIVDASWSVLEHGTADNSQAETNG